MNHTHKGKSGIEAKVIEQSIAEGYKPLITVQLKYPRIVHSELMTHRVFSRNASSSRAIPVSKIIAQVRNDPAMPVSWGKNQPGMQAREENDSPITIPVAFSSAYNSWYEARGGRGDQYLTSAELWWRFCADQAADMAQAMADAGYHKQVVNRLLEPYQYIHVVVTSTEWDNWFALRDHKDADPTIQELARVMAAAINDDMQLLNWVQPGEWHLPYVTEQERKMFDIATAVKISAARCARVSYMNHDGVPPALHEDLELFNQLATRPYIDKRGNVLGDDDPVHMSPTEHQACLLPDPNAWSGNFNGWFQHRKALETKQSVGSVLLV